MWKPTLFTLLAIGLSLASMSCALWAVITVRSRLRELQALLNARSTRSLVELEAAVASLESTCSSNSTTIKRLSSRIGMQDVRERRRADPQPSTPAETKIWLRRGLANGSLKVIRDGPSTEVS